MHLLRKLKESLKQALNGGKKSWDSGWSTIGRGGHFWHRISAVQTKSTEDVLFFYLCENDKNCHQCPKDKSIRIVSKIVY